MPSSNKLNYDKVLIEKISSGITPVPADAIGMLVGCGMSCDLHMTHAVDTSMIGVEDLGKKLLLMLSERQAFHTEFLVSQCVHI